MTDDQQVQRGVSQDPRPSDRVQPHERVVPPFPKVNQRQEQTELRQNRKGPVQMSRHQPSLTGDGRGGGEKVAGERPYLQPAPAPLFTSPDDEH